MNTIIDQLRTCEIFSGLDPSVLALIAPVTHEHRCAAGTVLFAACSPRQSFFLILEGQVEVRVHSGDAAGTLLILGPGDGTGEAGLLEPGVHSATGTAVSDLRYLTIQVDEVRARLTTDADAAMSLYAAVARIMVRRLQYSAHRRAGWDEIYRPGVTRTEHDLLGEREVPEDARYGVQTLRAMENFPITGIRIAHFPHLVRSLAMVKQAASRANRSLELLPEDVADAILSLVTGSDLVTGQILACEGGVLIA